MKQVRFTDKQLSDVAKAFGHRSSNFTLSGELGRGTTSNVHRILDSEGKPYAVKVSNSCSDSVRRSFECEDNTLSLIDHTNIPCSYGVGSLAEGNCFLVMDYVDGVTWDSIIKFVSRAKTPKERHDQMFAHLDIIDGVLKILEYLISIRIPHLDIKPANVMIGSKITLIDFGFIGVLSNPEYEIRYVLNRLKRSLDTAEFRYYFEPEVDLSDALRRNDPTADEIFKQYLERNTPNVLPVNRSISEFAFELTRLRRLIESLSTDNSLPNPSPCID